MINIIITFAITLIITAIAHIKISKRQEKRYKYKIQQLYAKVDEIRNGWGGAREIENLKRQVEYHKTKHNHKY